LIPLRFAPLVWFVRVKNWYCQNCGAEMRRNRLPADIYICRSYLMKLRRSPQTVLVLTEFLNRPQAWKYGYDISRNTGLKSGTLYPILMRLARRNVARMEAVSASSLIPSGVP
jgi:hypothetical protein